MKIFYFIIMFLFSLSALSEDIDAFKLDVSGIRLHMSCNDVERVASQRGLRISDRLGVRTFSDIVNKINSGKGLQCPKSLRGKNNEHLILRWTTLPKGIFLQRIRMNVSYSSKIFQSRATQKYGKPTLESYSGLYYGVRVIKSTQNQADKINQKKPFLRVARDWLELADLNIVKESEKKIKAAQISKRKPINPTF